MTFLWPAGLVGLSLLPALGAAYLVLLRRRDRARAEIGLLAETNAAGKPRDRARRHLPPGLMLLGLAFLLVGVARPRATVQLPHVQGTVILAIDVSNSMRADDVKPTRLDVAKAAAREFASHQPPTIRMGVVAFGGGGVVVHRPTDDREAVLAAIDRLTPQGGTSLGEGIFASLSALTDKPMVPSATPPAGGPPALDLGDLSSSVVVLFTDGENTRSPDPLTVAQAAADAGARVFAVGVGTPEGAVLQQDGFNIHTQLNEEALRQIADTTNAAYYRAGDAEALSGTDRDIALHMTVRGEEMEVTSVFAGAGLVVLLAAGAMALLWFGRVP
jgi:Ca-activated chloride channel family protein